MDDDTKVINLFKKEEDTVLSLIMSAMDTGMDEMLILGIKDKEIYFGSSNYDSKLKMIGAIEILKSYVFAQDENDA